MQIKVALQDPGFIAGIVVAKGVKVAPTSPELKSQLDALIALRKQEELPQTTKDAVRDLLRRGGFKPSGRNKPASEYLAQAAREDRFPFINNLVDINNLMSLKTGFPISLLDLSQTTEQLTLRYGRKEEMYVFNSAGQEIELEGLITACSGEKDQPLGNAIKDSMAGKIKAETNAVCAVIYGDRKAISEQEMRRTLEEFASHLKAFGSAEETSIHLG